MRADHHRVGRDCSFSWRQSKQAGKLMEAITVRRAMIEDAAELSALAIRSKAHWGYSISLLEAFRAELAISEAYLFAANVFVVETHGRIAGFAGFSPAG